MYDKIYYKLKKKKSFHTEHSAWIENDQYRLQLILYILHYVPLTFAPLPVTILYRILTTILEFLSFYHLKPILSGGMFFFMIRTTHPCLTTWNQQFWECLTPCVCHGFAYILSVKMIMVQHTNDHSEEISCMILNNFSSLKWEVANQIWGSIFNYMLNL